MSSTRREFLSGTANTGGTKCYDVLAEILQRPPWRQRRVMLVEKPAMWHDIGFLLATSMRSDNRDDRRELVPGAGPPRPV
jgi:hypothetical protein